VEIHKYIDDAVLKDMKAKDYQEDLTKASEELRLEHRARFEETEIDIKHLTL
jgi:hypothetical protein